MRNKLMPLNEAVKKYIKDRSMILMGGFPMSRQGVVFCKEILRQKKAGTIQINDLVLVGGSIGFGGDLLVAEGVVDSVISTFSSHERAGLSVIIRESLEKGLPRKIKWEDESNLTLNFRIMAGSLNLPFIPSNSGVWGDLRKSGLGNSAYTYPKNILCEDPYGSGEKVALLQAINPHVSVVHVPFADTHGNGIILGALYYDFWAGRAGKDIILVADRIVDTEMCRHFPNMVTIPGVGVSAVVPWHLGSWPANSPGLYGEDLEHISSFIKSSRGTTLRQYIDKYVYSWETYEDYLQLIGKDNIKALETNPSTILAEPFQQWIFPDEKVKELLSGYQA